MKRIGFVLLSVALAGCGDGLSIGGGNGLFGGRDPAPEIVLLDPSEATIRPTERPDGTEGDEADGTPAGPGGLLGFSVTSLGDATVPGLWLETPLVDSERQGRVVAENGQSIVVTLRPSGGERNSGSRLSLEGYQALGLPLTALPTLTVTGL